MTLGMASHAHYPAVRVRKNVVSPLVRLKMKRLMR